MTDLAAVTAASAGALRLRVVDLPTQVNLRLRPPVATLAGIALPSDPTAPVTDGVRAAGLGPDEWLLLAVEPRPELEARLRAAAGDRAIAVTDVGAARVALEVAGPGARALLAHGCALDLAPAALPVGTCAGTRLALVDVVLLAVDAAPTFHVLVRSSSAQWLITWLLDAAAEFVRGGAA